MLQVLISFLSYAHYAYRRPMFAQQLTQVAGTDVSNSTGRYRRHTTYVSLEDLHGCYLTEEYSEEEACAYLKNNDACLSHKYTLNYVQFFVCYLGSTNSLVGILITLLASLLIGAIFVLVLVTVGQGFIIPNLLTLAIKWKNFGLGSNGFTFGFIVIANLLVLLDHILMIARCMTHLHSDVSLAKPMGDIFTTFCLGTMLLCSRAVFRLKPVEFLPHMFLNMFLIGYTLIVEHFVHEHELSILIRTILPIVPIVIYILYSLVLIIVSVMTNSSDAASIDEAPDYSVLDDDDTVSLKNPIDETVTRKAIFNSALNPFLHLRSILPMILIILIIPLWFILAILWPVVDDKRPLNGWCKELAALRIILWTFLLTIFIPNWYIKISANFIGAILCLLILILTKWNRMPRHLEIQALITLLIASLLYLILCNQLDSFELQIINFLKYSTPEAAYFVISPIGFLILEGGLIWMLIEAKLTKMVFGVITGVVASLAATALHDSGPPYCVEEHQNFIVGANSETAIVFIIYGHAFYILIMAIVNYELRTSIGCFLSILFIVFYGYIILDNIHPYGTEHDIIGSLFRENSATWA